MSWADQHWPYVRGRYLVECGLRLERLPMEDMLDVCHYFFETDSLGEKELLDAKHQMRQGIYRELYKRAYTWGESDGTTQETWGTKVNAAGVPLGLGAVDGPDLVHKAYTPPTPMNPDAPKPFGAVLDAPLG